MSDIIKNLYIIDFYKNHKYKILIKKILGIDARYNTMMFLNLIK